MALRTTITQRQRRIGFELRKLRDKARMTVHQGAEAVDMGRVHLTHVEHGRTAISSERLRALCAHYGCTNSGYIEALVRLSESDGKGWWSQYRKLMPQSHLDLAELESVAAAVHSYETLIMPGLLQTETYMRGLIRSSLPTATAEEIETAVRYRLARQQVLSATHQNPVSQFVIHEAALRTVVGGPEVMREQLIHLIEVADQPGISIKVLPFSAGPRACFGTSLLVLSPGVTGLETVVLERPGKLCCLMDETSVSRYQDTFDVLYESALPQVVTERPAHARRDSLGLIQHILYTL